MLIPMLVAQAAATASSGLACSASFQAGPRTGYLSLRVDDRYKAQAMYLSLYDSDGWTQAQLDFDPVTRRLPGTLSHIFFFVRFTQPPVLPLSMKAYADGRLRWQKTITTPYVPGAMADRAKTVSGTADHLARADDALPVATPRELTIVLTDAKAWPVGTVRYPLLGDGLEAALTTAIAQVETDFGKRACRPPPPPLH